MVVATGLLSVKRAQPHIDDREVDWILAVLFLGVGIWVLRQWPGTGHDVAGTVAWLLCSTACLLLVSGTRAMSWAWPAALPALVWLLPTPWRQVGLLVLLILAVLWFLAMTLYRGVAPASQLIQMPGVRLAQVGVALLVVAVAARWGVGL